MDKKFDISNVHYELISSSDPKLKEVQVLFNYQGKKEKYFIFIEDTGKKNYINEAKEIFKQDLKSGKVVRMLDITPRGGRHLSLSIAPVSILGVVAITFASLFTWKMLTANGGDNPGPSPFGDTYKLTFNCSNCKVYDEIGETEIGDSVVVPASPYTLYCKFKIKGIDNYKAPISKSSITVKKTADGENVEFEYDSRTCEITVPAIDNLTFNINGIIHKTLEEYTWDEINEISTCGRADDFFDVYDPSKPELNCKRVQLKHQDKNGNGIIDNDEYYQTVRIIGINQDCTDINNPEETKIGLTFDFADSISDVNGLSIATFWQDTNGSTPNHDYKNSTIRKALVGDTNDVNWYRFYGNSDTRNLHFATENDYKISVLKMLPEDLTKDGILKSPSKFVNIWNDEKEPSAGWEEQVVNDKLFLLSPVEMGDTAQEHEEALTSTYSYYDGADDAKRAKKQPSGAVGASIGDIAVDDGEYSGTKHSWAGYNSPSISNNGSHLWSRSAHYNVVFYFDSYIWIETEQGFFAGLDSNQYAVGIAPAFCI